MIVLQRKLQRPALPDPHVARPHLARRIESARVACLTAPAGYGKTTLLVECLPAAGPRRAWYTLDAADRDPSVLLAGVAAALGAPPPAGTGAPSLELSGLCRWLESRPAGIALVLDDLHVLEGAADAGRLLGELLAGAPAHLRILLAGRTMPPIPPLPRLRLMGHVRELGAAELAFSAEETGRLLAAAGRAEPENVAALHDLTRGWPAALRLLAAAGAPERDADADVFEYLAAEVLAGLPADRQQFLIEVSVLPEWTAAACDHVLERPGSDAHLDWLRHAGLLVQPFPDGAMRPHPLWYEFLRRRLRRDPVRYRTLQRRAALWSAARGEAEAALEHALAASDPGLVEPLLRRVADDCLTAGHLQRLEQWLHATPGQVLEAATDLLLATGEALRRAGHPRRAVRWLQQAALGYAGGDRPGGLVRAFCRLALAHADLGDWSEAEAALRQVESEWNELGEAERGEALLALAEEQTARGGGKAAAERFREAADLFARIDEPERAAAALAGLGSRALVALEQPEAAVAALRQAREVLRGAAACDALLAEARILTGLGRWDEAAALLQRAVAGSAPQQASLHWLQARIAMHAGDLEAAERLCRLGDLCLADVERTPGLTCAAVVVRAWLDHLSGDPGAALVGAYQARQLANTAGAPLLQLATRELLAACHGGATPLPGRLRVECLGAFRVICGDQEVPPNAWGRAQVRGVFQFLLLQPGFAAGREAVLEAFWPDERAESSRRVLRVTLHRLRKALQGIGCELETGPDVIRLPAGMVGWADLVAFRSHLAAAHRTLAVDSEACLEHCRAARALYRGDLLADATWPWAIEHRESVRRELVTLLQTWHEAARRLDRAEEAIAALEDLLALEPGQEEAASQLMMLLARAGRRADALRRYRHLVRWLREELGVDASAETRAIFKQLL